MPTSHICLHSSDYQDSFLIGPAQYLVLVPRIIATHWLRPDEGGAA
jgi:hypothetical protein